MLKQSLLTLIGLAAPLISYTAETDNRLELPSGMELSVPSHIAGEEQEPKDLLTPPDSSRLGRDRRAVVAHEGCCQCPEDGCCVGCNDGCNRRSACQLGGCCYKSEDSCKCGQDCCTGKCCYNFGKCCETTWCGLARCLGWFCIHFPWEECCEALGELDFDD